MAQLDIRPFANKFVIVDSEGNPFNDKMYPTERGAKQAISKSGHTYARPEPAPKPKAKTGKTAKNKANRVDMPAEDILELYDDCLAAAGYVKGMPHEQFKACDWDEANRVAIAGGFSSYWALKRVVKGVKWSQKPKAEREEIVQKQATRKEDRAAEKAAIASGELDPNMAQARNALARANGFPRYRELARAASRGDARAKSVKMTIDKAVPFAKVVSKVA